MSQTRDVPFWPRSSELPSTNQEAPNLSFSTGQWPKLRVQAMRPLGNGSRLVGDADKRNTIFTIGEDSGFPNRHALRRKVRGSED